MVVWARPRRGLIVLRLAEGNEPVCGFFPPVREYVHEKTSDHGGNCIGSEHPAGWECDGADSGVVSVTSTYGTGTGVASACGEGTSGCGDNSSCDSGEKRDSAGAEDGQRQSQLRRRHEHGERPAKGRYRHSPEYFRARIKRRKC